MQADTLFTRASHYNIFLKCWMITDIAVLGGKILFVGDACSVGITADEIFDCEERPLIPGLIDIHLHIESSLCTPAVFADAVLQHGVTTIVSEPHEIANVFGMEGIAAMITASEHTSADIFYGLPSSVPSTHSRMETTGGSIDVAEAKELFRRFKKIICLGEVMNFSELTANFDRLIAGNLESKSFNLIQYMQNNLPLAAIEGHCPTVRGLELAKLLYLGIDSDHCLQDLEGMKARLANGMFVELQEKSISKDIIEYLETHDFSGRYCFITDDVPPDLLATKGHVDYIIRLAMKEGLSLENVILASSYAPAARMGLRDRGLLAPGKLADMVLLQDKSSDFAIKAVFKSGRRFEAAEPPDKCKEPSFPLHFYSSINLNAGFSIETVLSLHIPYDNPSSEHVKVRVIRKNSENTYTEAVIRTLGTVGREILWNSLDRRYQEPKLNLAVVIERYTGSSGFSQGLLEGDVLSKGALCSTYAHDHHNILIVGDNTSDMECAFAWVNAHKGGICVASGGEIIAAVHLPIAGILSEKPISALAKDVESVQSALRVLGIAHQNPIMTMATITLPVSPDLKLTDKGLVDVQSAKLFDSFLADE
ncbi:MAG: amidohydrolase family protein [Spirochaetia bacterium]|nr:amidohydrolase family protein [Spirochaetia bacterium]